MGVSFPANRTAYLIRMITSDNQIQVPPKPKRRAQSAPVIGVKKVPDVWDRVSV